MDEHQSKSDDTALSLFRELSGEGAEAVDNLVNSIFGLSEEIPIAGAAVKSAKVISAYRDFKLRRDLAEFISPIREVDSEKRKAHLSKLASDPRFGRRAAENLLRLLDSLDDADKAALVGRAWSAYLRGYIDPHQLFNLCDSIRGLKLRYVQAIEDLLGEGPPKLLSHVHEDWGSGAIGKGKTERSVQNTQDWEILTHFGDCGLLTAEFRGTGTMGPGGGLVMNQTIRDFYEFVMF